MGLNCVKILFVENRYATRLFAAVARHLERDGHEIHWLVQNPVFCEQIGASHVIVFPAGGVAAVGHAEPEFLARIAATDRQVIYFGRNHAHYSHYWRRISTIIDEVMPDVVFGECTQFYELLAIEYCRRLGIAYLNPVTVGCPQGRFYFLSYDGKDPVGGDGIQLSDVQVQELLAEINERKFAPGYMSASPLGTGGRLSVRIGDWMRIATGWALGERYATPSPLRKTVLGIGQRALRRRWEVLARDYQFCVPAPYVLYALHVQPECSIDVWGFAWRDQAEIVRRAATALAASGIVLAVKPHPNSKYEISRRLMDVVDGHPNIRAIPCAVPMAAVFPEAEGILGVTGTVLLEAVFAGKPAISVGPNAMSSYPGIEEITTPEGVVDGLDRARTRLRSSDGAGAAELLRWLYRKSYPGEMFDPLFSPGRLVEEFVRPLHVAFSHVISYVTAEGSAGTWRMRGVP